MTSPKLYIADTGMVTSLGLGTASTAAAVAAGLSAYTVSDYENQHGEALTLALVPDSLFEYVEAEIDEGDRYNERHHRTTLMAIMAVREACKSQGSGQAIPLIMALSDVAIDTEGLCPINQNLVQNCSPWVDPTLIRSVQVGRAGGIEAIDIVFRYLMQSTHDFFLVGGSDSYLDSQILAPLIADQRLLAPGGSDSFVPGEGASFLLLTHKPEFARVENGCIIGLHPPGIAIETGHLYSDDSYRGEGLDLAFKKALGHHRNIRSIYSSMNGENYWAKELGVAQIRNHGAFSEDLNVLHPADCVGDLGAATATALICLAAEDLLTGNAQAHLVYSSSDRGNRAAIVVEKFSV